MSEQSSRTRDATATKRRILDAATEEFAQHGLAGARVAGIAARAAANPRMLYAYFGSKEGLFTAVLELAVERMRDTVELDATDLVSYAVAVFDAYSANTYLIRLALWQTLQAPGLDSRITGISEANETKITAIRTAQQEGLVSRALDAPDLLDAILTLAYGNLVLMGGIDNYTPHRRETLGAAVGAIVNP